MNQKQRKILFDGDEILAIYDYVNSDTIVISFSGYNKPGDPRPFYADGFLQKNNFSAVLVLAKNNHWYQTRELNSAILQIEKIAKSYKHRITYGQSMGAYGALLAAGSLSARAVVTAPQTTISTPNVSMVPAWIDALKPYGVIKDDIPEQITISKGIDIIYDPRSRIDRQHYRHISKSKLVQAYILPFGTHYIPQCLSEMRLMSEAILGIFNKSLSPNEFRKKTRSNRLSSQTYISAIIYAAIKRKSKWIANLLLKIITQAQLHTKLDQEKKTLTLEATRLKNLITEKWDKQTQPSAALALREKKLHNIQDSGSNNTIQIPDNMQATVKIKGNNNIVNIKSGASNSNISINITGDNNTIEIQKGHLIHGLRIVCGSYVPSHNTSLYIDEAFSIEPNSKFYLYNSGNSIKIGKNCMASQNITIRCGESPHLIFDLNTGEYIDTSDGVVIGDHVWIGENAYLTKKACIGSDNIVAACSVVTKKFLEPHCVIAGNPARIAKKNVKWVRNRSLLEPDSTFQKSIIDFDSKYSKV